MCLLIRNMLFGLSVNICVSSWVICRVWVAMSIALSLLCDIALYGSCLFAVRCGWLCGGLKCYFIVYGFVVPLSARGGS